MGVKGRSVLTLHDSHANLSDVLIARLFTLEGEGWLNRIYDNDGKTDARATLSSENSPRRILLTSLSQHLKDDLLLSRCSWAHKKTTTTTKSSINSKCTVVKLKMSLPFSSLEKLTFRRCSGFPLTSPQVLNLTVPILIRASEWAFGGRKDI